MKRFQQMTSALAKSLGYSAEQLASAFAPAEEEDVGAIINFRQKNLGIPIEWDDESYFRWRYAFSDQDQGGNKHNKLWVVKLDKNIVAMLGAQHMPVIAGEHEFAAIHPVDVLVDASIEGVGLGAWMQFALKHRHEGMVVIGSNTNSATLVQRIFHSMPNRQSWKMILNLEAVLSRHLKVELLAKLLAVVLNPVVKAINHVKLSPYLDTDIRVEPIDIFPESVEKLSASQRGRFFHRYRTAEFLNWKFVKNPNVSYKRLGLYKENELVGYVVFRPAEISGHKTTAVIEDFFWLEDDSVAGSPKLPEVVLAVAIMHLKQSNTGLVQITTYGERAQKAAKRLGFILRDEKLLFSLCCNVPKLEPHIYAAGNWFLTDADAHGDAS